MGLIPDHIVDEIIDRADIVDVVSSYVSLRKAGRNFKGLSPFNNEKTPSFVVSPEKQIFHCFSSGEGGNVVSFVMKIERMTFPEAIRFLADRVNVVIPEETSARSQSVGEKQQIFDINKKAAAFFHNILLSDTSPETVKARDYLKDRGFDLDTVKKFQLGFAPEKWDSLINHFQASDISAEQLNKAGLAIARDNKPGYYDRFRGRVMFPILDSQGRCRAFGARSLDPDNPAKYINSPETPVYTKGHHLYGFDLAKQAIGREDYVIVVEGYTDCIMPYQAGVQNIVASLGTALTVEQVRLLRRYTKNVCLLFDNDKAGENAMLRSLDMLAQEGLSVKVISLAEGEDPDSFIRAYGPEKFCERIISAKTLFEYKLSVMSGRYDTKTVEGQSAVAGEMLSTIDKFNNAVVQAGYIRRLSQALNVPEEALMAEFRKIANRGAESPVEVNLPERVIEKRRQLKAVEVNLLRLLLEEEEFITKMRDETALSDFQEVAVREVISKVYDLFDQGERVTYRNLVSSFEDMQTRNMLTALASEEDFSVENKEKMYRDCIARIKNDKLKSQRSELLRQIQSAEQQGDAQALEMLKTKFNELVKLKV